MTVELLSERSYGCPEGTSETVSGEGRKARRLAYPVNLERQEDGSILVSFPDIPEALTDGVTEEEARAEAEGCLIAALGGYIQTRRAIPRPSPGRGRTLAPLPAVVCEAADGAWTALRKSRYPPLDLDEAQELEWESAWHGWWSRHAIQAAREGGMFPDVIFRRIQDSVEVSWGDFRSQGVPSHVSFALRPGSVRFEPTRVAEPLYEVLEGAAAYLSSVAPHSSRIADLTREIRRLRARRRISPPAALAS